MFPSLFISHGSPELAIKQHKVADFLRNLPTMIGSRPKYIIIVSAHWVTNGLKILSNDKPGIIYDFYGFPESLYKLKYPAKNDLQMVEKIKKTLVSKHISISEENKREGYDHGVWSPLSLMYHDADIPIIQLSLPADYNIDQLMQLGIALQEFRDDSLIITSGNLTHDLRGSIWDEDAPIASYAKYFRENVVELLEKGDISSLIEFISTDQSTKANHPTLEHLLPIFISIGASIEKIGKAYNNIYMYANQAMDTIIFNT
ncbi:MAG: class III extradiol ring-cleavage dioxygenase [Sulfurospirillaceae bacterium]|nr:class III extradiol ring-cleavage dioxygenase [Sulfurospirillaceae bacterium]